MIGAQVPVAVGDSGGAVLVRGIPAGVASRSFGALGFTPLAEGWPSWASSSARRPDCGLVAPAATP